MSKVSDFFLITPAKNYSFFSYYNYRKQQSDFTNSFEKEAYRLFIDLKELTKDSNYSEEVRIAARQLLNNHKILGIGQCETELFSLVQKHGARTLVNVSLDDHRKRLHDVHMFWNEIESSIRDRKNLIDSDELLKNNMNRKRLAEEFLPNFTRSYSFPGFSTNTRRVNKPFRSGNFKPETKIPIKRILNSNSDDFGGESSSSEDEYIDNNVLVKYVHEVLETLGMKATMTGNSYMNPITKRMMFFDNGGVDIYAWYKEMEVLIRCKKCTGPVKAKTVREMEGILLNQDGKIGCIISESGFSKDAINMVEASKRKIILTTKLKAYFDIENYYNMMVKIPQNVPLINHNIIMDDVTIEVVKDGDVEVSVMESHIEVKGRGSTTINISCKKLCK
ncbi:hypothetical protein C1645_829889 [Glomus cerebriforme]|uniref:Restriction endonuclease type IV Mrr domain-containing protein n=1 Tax=Glomus cerebriforme TaxID=658196 RepID=A0A397SPS1_9GLOM|nr:hypothetical protein C1645_829889 [Glomus cerebriforme]